MGPDRIRWTDSRLDDLANELHALRDLPQRIGKLEVEMGYTREDVAECAKSVKAHSDAFAGYLDARRAERRADLRWIVGTVIASAALVVAAMGLILGHVG